ncbi:hypothetical protein [Bacillus mycoides]|uniref:hypothetical protein n=1 Tax=Bacillus mycoides TaxID=1405 RepID=UPI003A7FE081
MKHKHQYECINEQCAAIMIGGNIDGLRCVKCGGRTVPKPFKPIEKSTERDNSKELTIQVNVDTSEALKQMKEVTEAANECATALEKLEKVMNRFKGKSTLNGIKGITVELNGEATASEIVKRINDSNSNIRI